MIRHLNSQHGGESVPQVTVNNVALDYAITGTPADDGLPLVLVHGFMGNARTWAPIMPGLTANRQVVTYDHRGHGASTNTGDAATYTFDQLVADFTALVDAIGLERFHLLGHSMGGVVAMRYTLGHPDRVASLIPMDTAAAAAANQDDDPNVGFMRTGVDVARTQGMAALFDVINAAIPDAPEFAEMRESLRYDLNAMDNLAFVRFGEELLQYPSFLDKLAGLTIPATVLVGENDLGLRAASDAMAATIPNAKLVVIPNAGHNPHAENPQAWLEAVTGHLDN
jgi:pimeloyl-ACP methyl ester carboxylesterase